MNFDLRKLFSLPLALAVVFFSISILLAPSYPSSLWTATDNEALGLANALNMAYRLADRQMYEAVGMAYHPGVTFYLMSWLALALTGYPVASGLNFFDTVIAHAEDYHRMILCLAALAGAAGVYVFARTARNLVPVGVIVVGLVVWLTSSPATLQMFMFPGFDSFAIIINALFLTVMVPLAYEDEIDPSILVFAGCIGALAYLNKLSYVYIPLALYIAILAKLLLCGAGWRRGILLLSVFICTFALVVLAAAFLIIGWDSFRDLLKFHRSIILGSGLYGTGSRTVISTNEIWHAIVTIPTHRAYAVPIALVGGAGLLIGGLATGLKRVEQIPIAVISIGTGVAAVLSALIVLKHYEIHYTAGVSAALPSCVVCGYLFAKSWITKPWSFAPRVIGAPLVAIAILLMAVQVKGPLISSLASVANTDRLAKADLEEISAYLAASKRTVEFAYRTPFSQFGEGFVVLYGSVPRMTYDYLQSQPQVISSAVAGLVTRDVGAYVIDKRYFPNLESVKSAPNLALLDPKPVKFNEGDKLIELRTVFLLMRG